MPEDSREEDSECPPSPKKLCMDDTTIECEEMKDEAEAEAEVEKKRGKLSKYVHSVCLSHLFLGFPNVPSFPLFSFIVLC